MLSLKDAATTYFLAGLSVPSLRGAATANFGTAVSVSLQRHRYRELSGGDIGHGIPRLPPPSSSGCPIWLRAVHGTTHGTTMEQLMEQLMEQPMEQLPLLGKIGVFENGGASPYSK